MWIVPWTKPATPRKEAVTNIWMAMLPVDTYQYVPPLHARKHTTWGIAAHRALAPAWQCMADVGCVDPPPARPCEALILSARQCEVM